MALLLKMDGRNPLIYLYFIFFIKKISMVIKMITLQHNSCFYHLSVYNIDLKYVAWNGDKLDIKLLGKYVLL